MSEPGDDGYDLKQCGRCAAWIPRVATMCAYCGTSSPDSRIDPRPARAASRVPPWLTVTRALIAANVIYFLFSLWVEKQANPRMRIGGALVEGDFAFGLDAAGAYMHERVVAGEWWRVIACSFLHAGVIHLGFNMWALKQLGELAEELFGGAKLLVVYLICAAASALAIPVWFGWVLGNPPDEMPALVGASGAIFGVGGLLAAFLIRRGSSHGRAMGAAIGKNLLLMLVLGFVIPRISNTGHVGGMIPGAILGLVLRERFSTHLSPEARRNWFLVSVLAAVVAAVALGRGFAFSFAALGGFR